MKKIAVLGSRAWKDHEAVAKLVNTLFEQNGPYILVSGGGETRTPNAVAEATAGEFGFPVISLRPVQRSGGREIADVFGIDEWRLYRGRGQILKHDWPTWSDYASAAAARSWMIADRCDEGYVFWDGYSRGAAWEIELLEGRDKLTKVIR